MTAAELARELGISRQALHQRIKQLEASGELSGVNRQRGKPLQLDDLQVDTIKAAFYKGSPEPTVNPVNQPTVKQPSTVNVEIDRLTRENDDLRNRITQLEAQITEKDQQISRRDDQITELLAAVEREQKLHAATAQRLSEASRRKWSLPRLFQHGDSRP